ncbi:AsmA-like C-terminal region-containing protein [Poritiphilus flavus]|uniref:AsmA family protein n=1 Tax=Poritiphilus flavus TaxID=2697053 RepID=A0A6L9EGT9_9FLAO|nr:AsmA-like C-terminal region-containing protein [Poritiphilus flavus]NAS13905.1 AsmA family protein [Poritiphilus flavus]
MKKKLLKIAGILLFLFLAVLIGLPFLLEAKIGDLIKNNVNSNINGELGFSEASLSLISSFPNAEVSIDEVYLLNKQPFEGDTLFSAGLVELKLGLGELFKSAGEPISIKRLFIDKARLNIKVDESENANYDIGTASGTETEESSDSGFTFAMDSYEIRDSEIRYLDQASGIGLELVELNHKGSGDLSLEQSELQTNTTALVSFNMDSTNYLDKNPVSLEALFGIDLKENKYSFLKNEAVINQLPLIFEGFVQLHEDHQEVALSFKTPSSDFKNFLALVPENYTSSIEGVKTEGNFEVAGSINGRVDDTHIPKLDISLKSHNASFKYPDLPKAVTNINIDAEIKNNSGKTEDTFVDIKKASFNIDKDHFALASRITELTGNTRVNAELKGNMDLSNISKAYPMPESMDLKGILIADVSTAFDMASIEKKQYQNTRTIGTLNLRDFQYSGTELKTPLNIQGANITFSPDNVILNALDGKLGQTDFGVSGSLENLLGFAFNDEKIEGNFKMYSKNFEVVDFMVDEEVPESEAGTTSGSSERIKIPAFLDCFIAARADRVVYDNLNLNNVSGNLIVKDETVTLQNLRSDLFGGSIGLAGSVSTKEETSSFDMDLSMSDLNIGQSFASLDLFKTLAPLASALQGKITSDINISGNLKEDMTPNLASISGDLLAKIFATEVDAQKAPLLSALDSKLSFLDTKDLNLQDLKTALSFENGTVKVKPFTINYNDIAVEVAGGHSFDQKLAYTATLQVPAKYLGNEVNNLIAKIDEQELENLTIPVTANIGGGYTSPEVSTDLTSGVKQLTAQLVDIQKKKLINQGKDGAKDLLGGLLASNNSSQDSTTTESDEPAVKQVLGGILGDSETQKDSTVAQKDSVKTKDPIKDAAKEVLGGLFSRKKKSKKDSVN